MNNLDYHRRYSKIRSKDTLTAQTKKAARWLVTTLSAMIIVLSVIFIATTNLSSQKGYTLQQEKLKNEQLKNTLDNLTTKITQATAFSIIENSTKISIMKEIEEKNYVTKEDNKVK
ncbi:MAG: hypothetical protein ABIH78_03535 [Candidatus Peregrinibacteria bacterium]